MKCCICTNNQKDQNVHFFVFPRNPKRKQEWLEALGLLEVPGSTGLFVFILQKKKKTISILFIKSFIAQLEFVLVILSRNL